MRSIDGLWQLCTMSVSLDLFLIVTLFTGHAYTSQCTQLGNMYAHSVPGKRLSFDKSIGYMEGSAVSTCLRECMLRRKCEGIHYQELGKYCEMFYGGTVFTDAPGRVYYNISQWPGAIVGTCSTRPCGLHEKCLPVTPNHMCIPWCDGGENPTKGYPESPSGGPLHHAAVFKCRATWLPPPDRMIATCHMNNTWQPHPTSWNCTEIRTCAGVKECDPAYTDGVYTVHDGLGSMVPVTCSAMASLAPATSYTVDPAATRWTPECFR